MPEPQKSNQAASPWKGLNGLQIAFLITMCIGGFLFVRSPAVNAGQFIFRVAVVAGSAIGLLVVTIMKFNLDRRR